MKFLLYFCIVFLGLVVMIIYILKDFLFSMISKRKLKTWNAWAVVFIWICIGTCFFYLLEGWTLIDSFYFAVSTLTTVGYGDITPSSQVGRFFASIYILFGVGTVLASLSVVGREFLNQEEQKIRQRYARHHSKAEAEVEAEIEDVKKILKKNAKELKEQGEILESAEVVEEVVPVKKKVVKVKEEVEVKKRKSSSKKKKVSVKKASNSKKK